MVVVVLFPTFFNRLSINAEEREILTLMSLGWENYAPNLRRQNLKSTADITRVLVSDKLTPIINIWNDNCVVSITFLIPAGSTEWLKLVEIF